MFKGLRHRERGKRRAFVEGKTSYIGECIRNTKAHKARAIPERIVADIFQFSVPKIYASEVFHPLKAVRLDTFQCTSVFKNNASDAVASFEEIGRNAF